MIRPMVFVLLLLIRINFPLLGQTILPEVTLTYDFTAEAGGKATSLDTNISGSQIVIYLKGTWSRTDHINSLGRESSVFDTKTGTGFITREYGGQKILATLTAEEWKEQHSFYANLRFTDEEGVFAVNGYSCRKTKELKPADKIYSYTVFYDPFIFAPNKSYELAFPQLEGLPVLIRMQYENTVYRLELKKLERESIHPSIFEMPRKGYKLLAYREIKKSINQK